MFKLEALRALHGDALILHYGTATNPRYAVIDGGPKGVWEASLQPRLQALRKGNKAVPLRWVLLSHVDEDHVLGLINMLQEIKGVLPKPNDATAFPAALIHNTPGPAAAQAGVATVFTPAVSAIEAKIAAVAALQTTAITTVASYKQGAQLANLARELTIPRNPKDGERRLAGDKLPSTVVGPLKVTVISPTVTTLDKLIKAWKKQLGKDGGIVSSEVETKIQNLSSIVVLVESGTKKMLLTGDALDNDFLDDLDQLGFLDSNGQMRVDVLKLPHHGSKVNNHDRLFETIKAKHYVISADGRFDNPDPPTLERFVRSEKDRACTLWITNGPGEGGSMGKVLDSRYRKLDSLIATHHATRIKVRHPKPEDLSVTISV